MKFYLIGILGSGMSSLANILTSEGNLVKGADEGEHYTRSLIHKSIDVENFSEIEYSSDYFYIIGNAYLDHQVTKTIQEKGLNHLGYLEFIKAHFHKKFIGISGSHGKTSICSYLLDLTNETVIVGNGIGRYNKDSEYFIIEACEYKENFLKLDYEILLINNIDYDHVDFYKTKEDYLASFKKASKRAKLTLINGDKVDKSLLNGNLLSYGNGEDNDFVIKDREVCFLNQKYQIKNTLYGNHQYLNYLGALSIAYLLNYDLKEVIKKKLSNPLRRLTKVGEYQSNIIIDDYAHHPSEIKKSYESLKKMYIGYKIIVIFQPHTKSRLLAFYKEFIEALSLFDLTYVLNVFTSVREGKSEYDDYLLKHSNFLDFKYFDIDNFKNSVIVFMGAGDVYKYINKWIKGYLK